MATWRPKSQGEDALIRGALDAAKLYLYWQTNCDEVRTEKLLLHMVRRHLADVRAQVCHQLIDYDETGRRIECRKPSCEASGPSALCAEHWQKKQTRSIPLPSRVRDTRKFRGTGDQKISSRRGVEGWHTVGEIAALAERQKHKCAYCGEPIARNSWHKDHYIPVCHGGADWIENIRLTCIPCNVRKSGTHPDVFFARPLIQRRGMRDLMKQPA